MTLTLLDNHRCERSELGMLRRPSHTSSFASRASSSSSSSSASSASSYSSFTSSSTTPTLPAGGVASPGKGLGKLPAPPPPPSTPPEEEEEEEEEDDAEEVYVTSSSTIFIGSPEPNLYDPAYCPGYYNSSLLSSSTGYGSCSYYENNTIRSIFYEDGDDKHESQEMSLYVEGGESESEEGPGGHYEAIYEVISPSEDDLHQLYNHYDDDFDSDESDEAYSRLRPQQPDEYSESSREPQDSFGSDFCSPEKHDLSEDSLSGQQQQYGITKFANFGMRKLQRNWSLTKKEVRTGLNRIKKKSTFSTSDMRSTENLAAIDASLTSAEKRKWSFKSHFRKKPSLSMPAVHTVVQSSKKEAATFYLTLTIETDNQDASELSDNNSQRTVRSNSESQLSSASTAALRRSTTPSISSVNTQNSCDTPPPPMPRPASTMYTRKTSAGSSTYGPTRPKTAPPAPPPKDRENENKENEEVEVSKENIASRLNTLLSSGPMAPSGRRVLRTSECSSSDSSPVPVLMQPDDGYTGLRPVPVKYATIDIRNSAGPMRHGTTGDDSSEDEIALSSEITNSVHLNIPNARNSVASHCSSEGYIRASDIASAPPPLPLRQKPAVPAKPPMLLHMPSSLLDSDNRDYLEFNYDLNEEEPLYVSSHFQDEPLYQFYTATVLERATQNQGDCSSEDDYEVINDGAHSPISRLQSRPSAMELVTPADGRRTLWCELPEVVESGVLNQMSSQQKKVQEAMFEVLTSEASYLKSLNVLVNHFLQCPEFSAEEGEDAVLTRRERHILFSDIIPVKRCSELFLADLEKRWQESIKISTISDIVLKHAKTNFQVYIKYCSNQIYQDRILKELKAENHRFTEVLSRLESSRVCQSLAMHSFLMLPMQRITRLPLLVDAIFHRLDYATPHWKETKEALATLTKIVAECNEGARNMERMEEMLLISRQLDFREVKAIPLISASRWLVKKGELTRLTWRETDGKLTFGRRIQKHTLYFFLFVDLLVVTKKKGDDQYMVLDYCQRSMVQVLELDTADKFPGRILDGHKNLLIMTMLQNHENKTVEMVLSCPLESDRTRWVEAVTPRQSENPDERIYEEWDCPQVQSIHQYEAKQPDELSLEVSDVVNVLKKMADGWYQGERIRDGERGWFPGSFTVEVGSAHVRARNLRQRYRLLAISGSFVEELKREKERYDKEEMKKNRRRTITMKEVISSAAIN